jgi:hypothetical protein
MAGGLAVDCSVYSFVKHFTYKKEKRINMNMESFMAKIEKIGFEQTMAAISSSNREYLPCWLDGPCGVENYDNRKDIMMSSLLKISNEHEVEAVKNSAKLLYLLMGLRPFAKLHILPSIEVRGKFSYSRTENDTDAQRVRTKFGRIVRRQMKVTPSIVPDDVLDKITSALMVKIWCDMNTIVECKGREIVDAYSEYFGDSCMCGVNCDFVEIYALNPEKVSLLATFDGDGCASKALLWTNDAGKKILDRVYYADGYHMDGHAIVEKARELGANVDENPYRGRFGQSGLGGITMKLSKDYIPYMDTYRYAINARSGYGEFYAVRDDFDYSEGYFEACDLDGGGIWINHNGVPVIDFD